MVNVENKIQRYESYKDSGVEWLGEIPEHWEVLPLFALTKLKSIVNNNGLELLSVYLDRGVIRFSDVKAKRTNVTSLDLSKYQLVEPGDFVLNNQQAWRGSVGVSNYTGIVSPAYIVLSLSNNLNPIFANYLFRDGSMVSQYLINSKGVGTIQRNLYWPSLRRSSISLPPLQEQTQIAQFLDDKTSKIDAAIGIKEQQINLLKERKQILIHKAVTRGLDDRVALKDSGVEWIGEIPEHWEVKRLKFLTRVKRGASPRPIDNPIYFNEDGEFKWVRIADVSANNHYLKETVQTLSKLGASLSVKIFPNELFLSIAGTVGKPMISHIKCCIHDGFVYFPDLKVFYREYLYRVFENGSVYNGLGKFGTQLNLNTDTVSNISIPIPSEAEITNIIKFIEAASKKIETAIDLKQREIEKLKEYKSSLINGVVTGKVRVC